MAVFNLGMHCRIADVIVEVPAAGDLVSRCRDYLYSGPEQPEIVLDGENIRYALYDPRLKQADVIYLETGWQFGAGLLSHGGFYLHASAVEVEGKAYLFSANCGVGKSTHARLWQQLHGSKAQVINDDKPALRCLDGVWYAYGTPWCGKDGINQNRRAPLAGICFLKRGERNAIAPLSPMEAIPKIMTQTMHKLGAKEELTALLSHLDKLLNQIPVFELECLPEEAAARLSYETMRRKAEEMGL